jgi:AAA15 family ATPase/GTPase
MLIEFSVGNYRSFNDKVTFSMVAAPITAQYPELDANNVFAVDEKLSLLKSAAIYGANASGKSNLSKALNFMKWFMVNSSKETQSTEKIRVDQFSLSTATASEPSFFEIVFLLEHQQYRYGFEVNRDRVVAEWLFYVPTKRETKLFERNLGDFSLSKKYGAAGRQKMTRPNALFLSVCAQLNLDIANQILGWITNNLNVISGLSDEDYLNYTLNCIKERRNKAEIIQLLKNLDLDIHDINLEPTDPPIDMLTPSIAAETEEQSQDSGSYKPIAAITLHRKFDREKKFAAYEPFMLEKHESEGTKKIFALTGPIVDTLENGKVLVVDEYDARLHPLVSRAIVKMFNSNKTNPHNAQLIFMTHDTNLLDNRLLRRDQIWFAEKDHYGATDLYSLAEYKVRKDASFEKDYIKGKYGAIPFLGDLSTIIEAHG